MSLLTNAVVLSVLVMAVLCVLRLNVLLSIIIAALVAGWLSPLPLESLNETSQTSLWQYFLLKTTTTGEILIKGMATVSYTHLTLPTKVWRCRSRWSPYH